MQKQSILKGEAVEFLPLILHLRAVLAVRFHRAVGEVLIEVGGIRIRGEDGHKGSLDCLGQQGIPVHFLEPRVVFDLVRTVGAQTVFRVLLQQALQDTL